MDKIKVIKTCKPTKLKVCEDENCLKCYEKSFASQPKSKFWSASNTLTPRQITKCSAKNIWFNCDVCKHEFTAMISHVDNGRWCPYCGHKQLCNAPECEMCFEMSFASSPRVESWSPNNNIDPRFVFKSTGKSYLFNCNECNREFSAKLNNVKKSHWCSLCKNKTETKLYKKLIELGYDCVSNKRFDWCRGEHTKLSLPFDFIIEDLKIIIELDGKHHFKQVHNWQSPEETKKRDIYKMKKANENGYSVIRLMQHPVWEDAYDWESELVANIKKYDTPRCLFISLGNEYDWHIRGITGRN